MSICAVSYISVTIPTASAKRKPAAISTETIAVLDIVVECKVWGTPMKQYLWKCKNECLFRSS